MCSVHPGYSLQNTFSTLNKTSHIFFYQILKLFFQILFSIAYDESSSGNVSPFPTRNKSAADNIFLLKNLLEKKKRNCSLGAIFTFAAAFSKVTHCW